MQKLAFYSLLLVTSFMGSWITTRPTLARPSSSLDLRAVLPHSASPARLIPSSLGLPNAVEAPKQAQILYPPVGEHRVLRVVGKGQASQAADTAYLELSIAEGPPGDQDITPTAVAHHGSRGISSGVVPVALTEADVAPIVTAIKKLGISGADIKVQANRKSGGGGGFPFPFPSPFKPVKTLIGVRLERPTRDRIEQVITVARDAAVASRTLTVKEASIRYAVDNCQRLEQRAYRAAVADAKSRAVAIATATNATLDPIPSIAEPFYNAFIPNCSGSGNLPFQQRTSLYDPTEPISVEVNRSIFVTYTFKP